jgi:hypothetical protein
MTCNDETKTEVQGFGIGVFGAEGREALEVYE